MATVTTHDESYIEVTGAARAEETVRELYAHIDVEVRAAPKGGAGATARQLRNAVVRELREAGMRDDELIEGGVQASRSWWWRRKHERQASHTILLKCDDYQRLVRALAALEPLATDARTNIDVHMPPPRFEGSEESKARAHAEAVRAARAKAEGLAAEAGVRITSVLRIEEPDGSARRGDDDHGVVYGLAREVEHDEISSPTREVEYAVRVRFGIAPIT